MVINEAQAANDTLVVYEGLSLKSIDSIGQLVREIADVRGVGRGKRG